VNTPVNKTLNGKFCIQNALLKLYSALRQLFYLISQFRKKKKELMSGLAENLRLNW
jgi:hypothetical protein